MSFYDEVLRELVVALGAALFLGNVYALVRRRSDRVRAQATAAPSRARRAGAGGSGRGSRPQGRSPGQGPRGRSAGTGPRGRSASEGAAGRSGGGRDGDDLPVAPVARTVTYALLGLVMCVAGLASILAA